MANYQQVKYIKNNILNLESLNTEYTPNNKSIITLQAKILNPETTSYELNDKILWAGNNCNVLYYNKIFTFCNQKSFDNVNATEQLEYIINIEQQAVQVGEYFSSVFIQATETLKLIYTEFYEIEIYSLIIKEDNDIIHNFVPATQNGKVGLYDKVKGTFIEGKNYIAGEEIEIPPEVELIHKGKISGVGNSITRNNEITADDLAILRNFIFGWESGVLNIENCNFNAYQEGNNIIVEKGIMFAYGYFGYLPNSIQIPFIRPSAIQYRIIYAEIDRSVIPNTFKIKVKNNQGSNKVKSTTFRQDYLTSIKTGVYQLPLWLVKLDNSGIADIDGLADIRDLKNYIKKANKSNVTTGKITKEIFSNVTTVTQPITNKSKNVSTTEFVHLLTRNYIDN